MGLGAIGAFVFGIVALIFGLTIFSVILILGSILLAIGFLLYYVRAIPLGLIEGIKDSFKRSK